MQKAHSGDVLTGASALAAERYESALEAFYCYAGDPLALLEEALADSPQFVMGHALKAYLTMIGTNAEAAALGVQALARAEGVPANDRERGHLVALAHLRDGALKAAGRVLEDLAIANPRDGLALQVGHLIDFLVGDSRMLRDRIGRALPSWSPTAPGYHAVLGMHAFGLEESGQYGRAEEAARRSLDLNPRNGWSWHAVAHVMEMQDRRRDGVAWFRGDLPAWTGDSFFQVHNWWHLALFHLGLGEVDEVLALYDGPIWGAKSEMAFDMVDAAALLWRLHLRGVDLGERWAALADAYEAKIDKGTYAFDDAHAMMAFVGAGRTEAARALLDLQRQLLAGDRDNAGFVRDVGLPVMEALHAFGEGRYALTLNRLRDVRSRAARFGGSHAQRDVIDLTIIEAAARNGDLPLRDALLAERANALPV
ncbi:MULTISPECIES: tetratricopeptide repeat protein [unclassified Phenylobacterium]|uniref:tetratricopeptide repeat protein n=1 Tax=unclassified Phenylobacterium TaxID=2640670 RepID=UPI0022B33716|nr:tetratricopeptide repeat protein [Phenylobacterium sp. NIBR 498073]WGU41329.1 tetratricopeptide repeat protein [Phenylobacterium sp. NIBR 498073]